MRPTPFIIGILFYSVSSGLAQPTAPTYWQDIRPVLRKHCTVCHSQRNLKEPDVSGGLALDTLEAVKKGSDRMVLVPGHAAKSRLYELLVTKDKNKRMPLDANPLPQETIDQVKRWIDGGAPEGKQPADASTTLEKTPASSAKLRKLDVTLPTAFVPPAELLGKGVDPTKLDLLLKVGPLAPVAAVAFSPDGKYLATGSYGQAAVWDLEKGQLAKLLTNVLGAVHDVRFSPDGKLLAVGGGQPSGKGEARLYSVGDWKLLEVLRGHDDVVFSISFRPDGKQIATASFDQTVRLWDAASHKLLRNLHPHSDFVYAVAFSPDGKRLISASKDRTVRILDAETDISLFTLGGVEQDVLALAMHPDGKTVVSAGYETGIIWWNSLTGEKGKTQGGHGVAVHELAFSKNGKKLVSAGGDRTLRTWDGTTGGPLKTFVVGSSVYAAAINPKGNVLASGSFDGLTKLWDEATGRHLATLLALPGEKDQPAWLMLTPEGYATGSDNLVVQVRWRTGGKELTPAPAPLWTALRQPEQLAKALRGEVVPAPMVDKK